MFKKTALFLQDGFPCWVSIGPYWLVPGQYSAVMVGTWWYWVIKEQYRAVQGVFLESVIVVRFVVICWEI